MARGIQVGDTAPDFTLPLTVGRAGPAGGPARRAHAIVLYFYPRDNTSGCTAEACAFRDSYEVFTDAGAEVIGISSDSVDRHAGLLRGSTACPSPLLSDKGGQVRKTYGVAPVLGLLPGRVTYVIDPRRQPSGMCSAR